MSFVAELRQELVEAAEREQTRRVPRLGSPSPRLVVAVAVAAVMALALVLAAAALNTRPVDDRNPTPAVTPTPDARVLFGGTMTPDVRYVTAGFVPTLSFLVRDGKWRAVVTDRSDLLLLERGEGYFEPGGERRPPAALTFSYVREVFDPAVPGLQASRRPAPADFQAWLRAHPDLVVGRAEAVTVGGVPGERFPIEVRFDRPTHPDPECRRRWQVTCTALTPGASLQTGTLIEMTILRTEPYPLVIAVDHFTKRGLREVEKAAAPVLESLQIGVR
jgi:hypothetical protein